MKDQLGREELSQAELVELRLKEERTSLPKIDRDVISNKQVKEMHLKSTDEMAELLAMYCKAFFKKKGTGTIVYNVGQSIEFVDIAEEL